MCRFRYKLGCFSSHTYTAKLLLTHSGLRKKRSGAGDCHSLNVSHNPQSLRPIVIHIVKTRPVSTARPRVDLATGCWCPETDWAVASSRQDNAPDGRVGMFGAYSPMTALVVVVVVRGW